MKLTLAAILLIFCLALTACSPAVEAALPPAAPTASQSAEIMLSAAPALEPGANPTATQEIAACPVASSQPALYGLWTKEQDGQTRLLCITEKSVYLVDAVPGADANTRESFFTVQSVDWVKGVLELQLTWVRVNGQYGGFDSPSRLMQVTINDDTLYYSLTDAGLELPPADNGPWVRQ